MSNPLHANTPATMPAYANVAAFTWESPPVHEFATGMGYTRIVSLRDHLRRDGFAAR